MVTGVGAMTWSPLACGIITGKYENGIPESSRASMKVSVRVRQNKATVRIRFKAVIHDLCASGGVDI